LGGFGAKGRMKKKSRQILNHKHQYRGFVEKKDISSDFLGCSLQLPVAAAVIQIIQNPRNTFSQSVGGHASGWLTSVSRERNNQSRF